MAIDAGYFPGPRMFVTICALSQTGGHTDLHFMKGDWPIPLPAVLGHEGSAVVEKVGPGVTTVNFMRAALRAQGKEMPAREFLNRLSAEMQELKIRRELPFAVHQRRLLRGREEALGDPAACDVATQARHPR